MVVQLYVYIYILFLYSFPLLFFTEYGVWLLGLHNGVLLSIHSHYTVLLICIHLNFSMTKVLSLKKRAVRDVECSIICIKLENIKIDCL